MRRGAIRWLMGRWLLTGVFGLAGMVGLPGGAQATGIGVPLGQFPLHANGDTVFVNLPPGVYAITVKGVYNYDNVRPGLHLADAECSNDHALSQELVDYVAHDAYGVGYGHLYPSPLSQWQRYRYTVSLNDPAHTPFWSGNPLDDTLDVYIDGQPVSWVPLSPTVVDTGPGIDAGCDSATHTYTTVVVSFGGSHTFKIFDTNPTDNADVNGGLTALIAQVA